MPWRLVSWERCSLRQANILPRLGAARAYALQGDTEKARSTYQEFLTLWKDADPDIPIMKQVKAAYNDLERKDHPAANRKH